MRGAGVANGERSGTTGEKHDGDNLTPEDMTSQRVVAEYPTGLIHGPNMSFVARELANPLPEGTRVVVQFPWRPRVVCICGSTRFLDTLNHARREETLKGNIVLSSEVFFKTDADLERLGTPEALALKEQMDALHLRKIDLADEVLVLNVGGYMGTSTKRELEYARAHQKRIRFWE